MLDAGCWTQLDAEAGKRRMCLPYVSAKRTRVLAINMNTAMGARYTTSSIDAAEHNAHH